MKYEYKIFINTKGISHCTEVKDSIENLQNQMNNIGDEGWEIFKIEESKYFIGSLLYCKKIIT